MESSGGASTTSSTKSYSVKRVNKLVDQKWKFIPFLAELEAAPKEYARCLLWGHVIIDTIQVFSLTMMPEHSWGTGMAGLTSALSLANIPIYRIGSNSAFYAALVLMMVTTLIYIIFFVYMGFRCFFMKRYVAGASTYNSFAFRVFRHTLYLFSSILFIPILQNYLAIAYRSTTDTSLVWYDGIASNSWLAITSITVCCLGVILHVCSSVMLWTLCAESSVTSQHPLRRFNTFPDVLYLVYKLISCVLYDQFWNMRLMLGHGIWMCAASAFMLLVYILQLPFYDELTLKIRITLLWLCTTYSLLCISSHIGPVTRLYAKSYQVDLIIFCATIPFLTFVYYRFATLIRVSSIYRKSFEAMRNGVLSNPVVYFPKNLPRYPHLFTQNRVMLDGIESTGYKHRELLTDYLDPEVEKELVARKEYEREEGNEVGADLDWQDLKRRRYALRHFVMPYIDYVFFSSDVELSTRFLQHYAYSAPMELSGYQLRYGAILYIKGLHQFETSGSVHLGYIHFLVDQAMQFSVAINEMQLLEKRELSIAVSYQLWKLEVEVTKGLQVGISNRLSALSNAKEMHAASLQRVVELWHELMQESRQGESKVVESNRALMRTRSVARQDYENLIYNQPGNLEVLCCYAVFCDHLLDDKDMSNQCSQFVRQFVQNRETNRMQGTRIQASLSAAVTQLKLSLENSKRTYHAVKKRSNIKFVHVVLIILCILTVVLIAVVLVFLVIKQQQVSAIQTTIYRMGQIRTLSAQIGLVSQDIYYNNLGNLITPTSTLKLLYGYMYDFSALFNAVMFGEDTRTSSEIDQFFRDQAAGAFQGTVYRLWTFFGISFANMNNLLSGATVNTEAMRSTAKWLAEDFPSEMNLASTVAVNEYITQMHSDMNVIVALGSSCLAACLLIEVVIFALLFYAVFYVEGVRSLVFALVKLVPKNEIRLLYRRVLNQHSELDVYMKMSPQEKVNRLIAVAGDATLNSSHNVHTGLLLRNLFAVVPSGKGDGKFITKAQRSLEEQDGKGGGDSFDTESNIEMSFAQNSAARYSVDDCFDREDDDMEMIHAEAHEDEVDEPPEEDIMDPQDDRPASVHKKTKRNKTRGSVQIATKAEYESVVSEQAYLLSNDKNTVERIFTRWCIFFSLALIFVLAGVIVLNLVANSKVSNVEDYNSQEFGKHSTFMEAFTVLTNSILAVANFAVSGDQRYFKQYIAAQSSSSWDDFRSEVTSIKSTAKDAVSEESFDMDNMYDGLYAVTDIVMRLLCNTDYLDNCVTNVPFDQLYISSTTWGTEASLYMVQIAPTLGDYVTFFNVLKGSDEDLNWDQDTTMKNVATILASDVFNTYVEQLITKMMKMDSSASNPSRETIKLCTIFSLVLGCIGMILVVAEFIYNYRRKRGGRHWVVQSIISGVLALLFGANVVISAINLKKNVDIDIDKSLSGSRNLFNNWCVPLYHLLWYPLMYINTGGAIQWNYQLMKLMQTYLMADLITDLENIGEFTVSSSAVNTMSSIHRLVMIPVVLNYEATKGDPQWAEDVAIFSPSYMDSFTWDFEQESDYLTVLATYHLVTAEFYSTREADLALSDAEKIKLAKDTLCSYRTDEVWNSIASAMLASDTVLKRKFERAQSLSDDQLLLFMLIMYFAVVQVVILVASNVELFFRYCINLVSMKHVSAVTVGSDVSQHEEDPMKKPGSSSSNQRGAFGSPTSAGPTNTAAANAAAAVGLNQADVEKTNSGSPKGDAGSPGSPSSPEQGNFPNEDPNNIEVKNANMSVNSNVLADQNRSIMENVETSSEHKKNKVLAVAAFVAVCVLLALTAVTLILLPIYSTHVLQYVKLIDESSQRRWMVVDTMTSMSKINRDHSSYGVDSERLRNKYSDYISLIYGLYFTKSNRPGQSEYSFVNLEEAQDDLLFSRNRFYENQTFLGTSISSTSLDGIQIVTTDDNGNGDEYFLNNPLFCSYSDMVNYMGYYSRGVGLVADGQWTDFVRRCFLYNLTVCTDLTFSYANDVYQPLLTGLAESDILFINFVHRSGSMYYIFLLVLMCVTIVAFLFSYFCLFIPFMRSLLQEDADSRMLIRILPNEVRSRYPVFDEILEGKKMTKESNQLHRIMASMSRMAVFAVEAKGGTIIRFNELAEDMFGYATSEVLGKQVSMFLAEDENGKPSQQQAFELLREARLNTQGETKELLMQRRNGQLFTASTRFLSVKLSSGDRVFVAFLEEVADRMRLNTLQKINQAVLDMHDDAIIHINTNGIVLQANQACTRLLGWEVEEIVDQNVSMLMSKEVGRYHNDYINRYMETRVKKRVDAVSHVEALHRDGTTKIELELVIKEIDPPYPSELTQFVGYLRDKSTEQELEVANSVADVLNVISPIPLIQVNMKGEVERLSASACELFQYKHSELLTHTLPIQHVIPENIDGNPQAGFIQRSQLRGPSSAVAQKRDRSTFPAVLTVRQIDYGNGLPYNIFVGYISDISKTLRLEKNGRMTYSVMIHSIYPVIVMDKTGVISFFNNAATKCFGYDSQSILGKSYRLLCCDDADEDDDGTRDWLKENYQGGSVERSIFNRRRLVHAKRRNGHTFPAELVMSEIPPINENDAAIVAILRELTEEIKVQRNYHMSELIDMLCPQGIIVMDSSGKIERFSPAGEECFGYHAGEVMGAPVQTIIPGIKTIADRLSDRRQSQVTTDGRASTNNQGPVSTNQAATQAAIKGPVCRIDEMVGKVKTNILGRHFDTRSINLMIHTAELSAVFHNGEKSYVLYCENISNDGELRDSAVFYRRIREVVDSPLLRVDDNGKIVYANKFCAEMFGYPSETALVGKSIGSIFAKNAVEGVLKRLRQQVRDFQANRTKSGMAQQQEEGAVGAATRGAHNPVRIVMQNEIVAGLRRDNQEKMIQCSVVQVSSFLNGTISFIFYIKSCDEDMHEQIAAHMNTLLVGISSLPLLVLDAGGTILHTSQFATQLLGYGEIEELIGTNLKSISNTNAIKLLEDYSIHAVSDRANYARRSKQIARKKNGHEFPVEMDTRVVGLESEHPVILISLKNIEQEQEKDNTTAVVRTMLELIRTPAVITNNKGVIVNLNVALLSLFGYGEKDGDLLIGKDVGVLMTDGDSKYHHRYITNYFNSGIKYSIDNTIVRPVRHRRGHTFHVNTTIREVWGASRDPKDTLFLGYFTLAPDPSSEGANAAGRIIEKGQTVLKKESIMPVEYNGRMVRNLDHWAQEENGIAFALLGKAGEVIRLSRAAERLLGYAPDEANGKPLGTVLAVDVYDQSAQEGIDRAIEVVSSKSSVNFALSLKATSRRGETLFLSTVWRDLSEFRTKILKDWTEMPTMLCCLHNTSSQLSATHNKLLCDAAVEACRQPTIFMGEDGSIKLFNQAAERCFQVSARDVIGRNVKVLMPRKTAEMHDRFIETYLKTNVPHLVGGVREVTARRSDGDHFSAMIRVTEVREPSTRFFIGQLEDVTERKKDEVFAIMSRLLLRQTEAGLLVFDARNALVMASPAMVKLLGYDHESAVLAQQNIIDQIFTPSISKLYREFVQPYQRQAENNVAADTTLLQNFANTLENLDQCPYKHISSAPLRLRGDQTRVVDLDVHIAMSGEVLIGIVLKVLVPKAEDVFQQRNDVITRGSAKYFPHPLCVVARSGRVEHCNTALAEALGYESAESLEMSVQYKPFWNLFPSFPPPQGAADLEEESKIFVAMMQQVAVAIINSKAKTNNNAKQQRGANPTADDCPVLRARMQDGASVVLQVSKVTPVFHTDPDGIADSSTDRSNAKPKTVKATSGNNNDIAYFLVELQKITMSDDTISRELESTVNPLLEISPAPMVICDENALITHVNEALMRVFDFTRDQLIGRSLNILMPRRMAEVHDRYIQDYKLARETRALVEKRVVQAETRTGKLIRVHVDIRDVTIAGSRCFVGIMVPSEDSPSTSNVHPTR